MKASDIISNIKFAINMVKNNDAVRAYCSCFKDRPITPDPRKPGGDER